MKPPAGNTEKKLSQVEPKELTAARSWIQRAKLVAFSCVVVLLLLANTTVFSDSTRFVASAVVLAIGIVAFVVGIHYSVLIPRLEQEALKAVNPDAFIKIKQMQGQHSDA